MDNNSPSPSISIKPKDSTIDSKFGVVVTTPNYLQFFSDVPSYYQFLKDPKNYKDLLLGTVNIGNLIRNSLLINPEFKQLVRDIVSDIEIPSIDTDTIVTIEGEQEVKGRKDFTGGLAVNGQNLIYDPVKKVWQLTGDLVVTGAVTMFGSLSGFTPSTVTDAVLVDGATIVKTKNPQGQWQLTAIGRGGGEGGGLTSDEVNILIANALSPVNKNLATKWTQDDTKITNWDSAFNWGDHSKAGYMKSTDFDTQLKKYILKDTVEQISARHNFTDGLQIAGINIYKSQDKTIYLDANLVVSGAFAMFGKNSTTFETIWKDIPFDDTMEWTGSVWRVKDGGSGGLDTNAVNVLISEYLNRTGEEYAKQSWVNQQGFAKQSALDAAVASLTAEIGKKWTQNDAKISNWDSAYGWGNHANAGYVGKTYVDAELAKYVKLATAQSIEARHNFVNGLQIGGLPITKSASANNTIYLDANLVVSGAITMFGKDSTTFPTIWANIPFNLEHMSWDGSQWNIIGGGGSGGLDTNAVNVLISEYLAKNNYATISDISSALVGYATQSWVGDNYLAKSGGTITGASGALTIARSDADQIGILFSGASGNLGFIGFSGSNTPAYIDYDGNAYPILHSGNIGQQSVNRAASAGAADSVSVTPVTESGNYSLALLPSSSTRTQGVCVGNNHRALFNPSTGALTAASFVGNLTGNADSATLLGNRAVSAQDFDALNFANNGLYSFDGDYVNGVGLPPYYSWNYSVLNMGLASGRRQQIAIPYDAVKMFVRTNVDDAWRAWREVAFVDDLSSYLPISGGTINGTINFNENIPIELLFTHGLGSYQQPILMERDWTDTDGDILRWRPAGYSPNDKFLEINSKGHVITNCDICFSAGGNYKIGTPYAVGHEVLYNYITFGADENGIEYVSGKWTSSGDLVAHRFATYHSDHAIDIFNNGNVAIGGTTADEKLHVHGNVKANNIKVETITGVSDKGVYLYSTYPNFPTSAGDLSKAVMIGPAYNGYGLAIWSEGSGSSFIQVGRADGENSPYNLVLQKFGGNVAIGGTYANTLLHVHGRITAGDITANGSIEVGGYVSSFSGYTLDNLSETYCGLMPNRRISSGGDSRDLWLYNTHAISYEASSHTFWGDTTINGNLIVTGAVTMFSQLSMKNVIDYEGLSLAQLAQIKPARFMWKDGRDNRIHVGGIADYIHPILPEVVYETVNKELTVDYGSAAFYIGTSLIKPVIELWEVKDKQQKEIESLKKRVKHLENENRQLRAS